METRVHRITSADGLSARIGRRSGHRVLRLVVLAMMLTACSPDEGSSDPSGGGGDPAATSSAPGGGGSVDVRVVAPADCNLNAACGPGLRLVYGAEVSANLEPVPLDGVLAALDGGAANVAVLSSLNPAIALGGRSDLVVLQDDRGMIGPGNIVPIVRGAVLEEDESNLAETLNAVSAVLEEQALAQLVADVEILGSERAAALRAVENAGVALPEGHSDGSLRIGAQAFTESRVLAHLYAEALESAGYQAEVVEVDGYRNTMLLSIVFGDVDITPEYLAPLTDFIAGYGVVDWSNADAGLDQLRELIAFRDLVALDPSPARSVNAFVTTAPFAEQAGLATLSDLAQRLPAARDAAVPDDSPLLKEGSGPEDPGVGASGERVLDVQVTLLGLGFDPGELNGEFGQETRRAVQQFQLSQGLQADGVVGPATWEALLDPEPIDPRFFEPEPAAPAGVAPSSSEGGSDDGSAVIYLTFDDGPHKTYTPQVLDLLAQYNAKATFFVTGQNVDTYPELAQRIATEGHSVQSHTWNHADLRKLDQSAFNSQVRDTNTAIERTIGTRPTCLRPPYGARNERVTQWLDEEGMIMVLWDIDPQDWRKPGTNTIVREIVDHVEDGSVVLMHDAGGDRSQTVAALSVTLEALSERGFTFVAGCL